MKQNEIMAENGQPTTNTGEIILYQPDSNICLEVRMEEETVWLTQAQMAVLFQRSISVISRHIRNIFKEEELVEKSNLHFLQIANSDRPVAFYSLDVIISVGYRVKSIQGTRFRQWATGVLRDYLLRGYAVSNRFERLEQRMTKAEKQIEYFVHSALPPREGIFVDGQIYDAFELVERLIKSAQKSILLIDNYVDESVLTMMSERQAGVHIDIYTKQISKSLQLAEKHFNTQYGDLSLHTTLTCHDRFLIIDDTTVYLIGASLKDAGKRLFAFTQMDASQIQAIKGRL